jgi:hypothetical protein
VNAGSGQHTSLLGRRLDATTAGLTSSEAARRLASFGPNRVGADRHAGDWALARKGPGTVDETAPIADRNNNVLLGAPMVSGTGTVVSLRLVRPPAPLDRTRLEIREPPTSFERGLRSFGYLLMPVGAVLIVGVFAVNVILDRPVLDSPLFSLALAVGITPQLLPANVTLTLSRGARHMAKDRVIVKRLSSIEDFGRRCRQAQCVSLSRQSPCCWVLPMSFRPANTGELVRRLGRHDGCRRAPTSCERDVWPVDAISG